LILISFGQKLTDVKTRYEAHTDELLAIFAAFKPLISRLLIQNLGLLWPCQPALHYEFMTNDKWQKMKQPNGR
jgi:hypothetical protein